MSLRLAKDSSPPGASAAGRAPAGFSGARAAAVESNVSFMGSGKYQDGRC